MKVEIFRKGIKIDPAIPLQEGEILIKDEDTGNVIFYRTKNSHCLYIYNEKGKEIYHEQLNHFKSIIFMNKWMKVKKILI